MCGILGLVDYSAAHRGVRDLRAATECLLERGPDGGGDWSDSIASLSHRRLAIVDQSPASDQPMRSYNGRYVIVFNGEIYNYKSLAASLEISHCESDTRVLLEAYSRWGRECLRHLDGMFAFAIWDLHEKTLFAARDRIGVKPFYYVATGDSFAFASRPSALMRLPLKLEERLHPQALRWLFEIGYVPSPLSIHAPLSRLQPGHYLELRHSALRLCRYWNPLQPAPQREYAVNDTDAIDKLDELLTRSVSSRMNAAVPIGAYLSGGVDSSLVAAIMQKLSDHPIKTFTVGFEDPRFDESQYAARVASHIGARHMATTMVKAAIPALVETYTRYFDEPSCDTSALPTLALSAMASRHATVVLGGEGGDELFGGYWHHVGIERLAHWYRKPSWLRAAASLMWATLPGARYEFRARALANDTLTELLGSFMCNARDAQELLDPDVLHNTSPAVSLFDTAFQSFIRGGNATEGALRVDLAHLLPDAYLQRLDNATMAHSMEAREPLLGKDIVEFAMGLPTALKIRGTTSKWLLRALGARYLPRELLERSKQPFAAPLNEWLRTSLHEWARNLLFEDRLSRQIPLNWPRLRTLFQAHTAGHVDAASSLWPALVLLDRQSKSVSPPTRSLRLVSPA